MTFKKLKFSAIKFAIAASIVFAGQAYAGTNNLYVGSHYNSGYNALINGISTGLAGGSIDQSSLNGVALKSLWCIDIPDDVYVGNSYTSTAVSFNGVVTETVNGSAATVTINNANKIAYIVNNLASLIGTTTPGLDGSVTNEQNAIQVLIWSQEYNSGSYIVTADSHAAYYNDYGVFQTLLASNSLNPDTAYWITPSNGSSTVFQALVAPAPVPEPSLLALFSLGLTALGFARRSKV